jgi:hypothetical protein
MTGNNIADQCAEGKPNSTYLSKNVFIIHPAIKLEYPEFSYLVNLRLDSINK